MRVVEREQQSAARLIGFEWRKRERESNFITKKIMKFKECKNVFKVVK